MGNRSPEDYLAMFKQLADRAGAERKIRQGVPVRNLVGGAPIRGSRDRVMEALAQTSGGPEAAA